MLLLFFSFFIISTVWVPLRHRPRELSGSLFGGCHRTAAHCNPAAVHRPFLIRSGRHLQRRKAHVTRHTRHIDTSTRDREVPKYSFACTSAGHAPSQLKKMLSDSDSDFYGDDQADIAQLEARQAAYDPAQYWSNRAQLSMEVPSLFSSSSAGAATTSSSSTAARKLHNPYEGLTTCAKQLSESPQAFLSRLPPSTTDCDPVSLPWIYVANPFIPRCQVHHDNQQREEPEAPAEAGMQLGAFMEGGRERLELLGDFVSKVEPGSSLLRQGGFGKAPAGPKGAVMNREMKQARDSAVSDLLMLARMLKVRTGKVCSLLVSGSLSHLP